VAFHNGLDFLRESIEGPRTSNPFQVAGNVGAHGKQPWVRLTAEAAAGVEIRLGAALLERRLTRGSPDGRVNGSVFFSLSFTDRARVERLRSRLKRLAGRTTGCRLVYATSCPSTSRRYLR
jgi:hypothetical protein